MVVDPFSALGMTALAFGHSFLQSEAGKKFIESIVGKLGETITESGLNKINELRQLIWNKLRGNTNAERALMAAEQGDQNALEDVADYLKVAMKEDKAFAAQVQAIAQEINIGILGDSSQVQHQMVQPGGVGYQTQTGSHNTNFMGGTHYHGRD